MPRKDANERRIDNERKIVRRLLRYLKSNGATITSVWDSEEDTPVKNEKHAMDLIFNLDISRVYVKIGEEVGSIVLVCGNDNDIISDWSFKEGGKFDPLMDTFLDTIIDD